MLFRSVTGIAAELRGTDIVVPLNNVELRFVEATDGRGAGLGGLDVAVADRDAILRAAKDRDCYVSDDRVDICGVRWNLRDE